MMREVVLPELGVARVSIRPSDGAEIPATLLGVRIEALVEKFFEPIPVDVDD